MIAQGGNRAGSGAASGNTAAAAGSGSAGRSSFCDLAGKIWNAPNTALGLVYGLVGGVIDRGVWLATLGYVDLGFSISIGNNAIQFHNHPFQQILGGGRDYARQYDLIRRSADRSRTDQCGFRQRTDRSTRGSAHAPRATPWPSVPAREYRGRSGFIGGYAVHWSRSRR